LPGATVPPNGGVALITFKDETIKGVPMHKCNQLESGDTPTLGYWKIRGLATPITLLMKYANVNFKLEEYEQGDGPDFSRD
jgi:hypothetical protein